MGVDGCCGFGQGGMSKAEQTQLTLAAALERLDRRYDLESMLPPMSSLFP